MTQSQRTALLWCGLVVGFLPGIQNLAESLIANPGQRYVLLPVLLIGLLLHQQSDSQSERMRPRMGLALLVLGMTTQLFGIASGAWSIARGGLPIAMLGVSQMTGKPRAMIVVMAFAIVPIPDFVIHITSPWLESLLAAGAAQTLGLFGIQLDVGGPLVQFGGTRFEIFASDNGMVTALVLGLVGWYYALRADCTIGQSVKRALQWALLSTVVQPLVVVACVAALPLGLPQLGGFGLRHGVPIFLGILALSGLRPSPSIVNGTRPNPPTAN